jgi:hypothetical protein
VRWWVFWRCEDDGELWHRTGEEKYGKRGTRRMRRGHSDILAGVNHETWKAELRIQGVHGQSWRSSNCEIGRLSKAVLFGREAWQPALILANHIVVMNLKHIMCISWRNARWNQG